MLCNSACGIKGVVALPSLRIVAGVREVVTHLIDDSGSIVATYAKRAPWPIGADCAEFEYRSSPGTGITVLDCVGVRIAVQMCFDVNFSKGWDEIADQGADLVLYPSAYPAGFGLRARAWQSGSMVAAAVLGQGPSPVIESTGEVLARRTSFDNARPLQVNLNRAIVHRDHQTSHLERFASCNPIFEFRRLENDNAVLVTGPKEGPSVRQALADAELVELRRYLSKVRHAFSNWGEKR